MVIFGSFSENFAFEMPCGRCEILTWLHFFQTIKHTRTHAVTGYFNVEILFRFCLTDWTIFNRWASSSIQTIKLTIQLIKRYVDFSVWIHFQFDWAKPWTRLDHYMKIIDEIEKCGRECWEQQAQTIHWIIFGLEKLSQKCSVVLPNGFEFHSISKGVSWLTSSKYTKTYLEINKWKRWKIISFKQWNKYN